MRIISKKKAICLSAVSTALIISSGSVFSGEKQIKKISPIKAQSVSAIHSAAIKAAAIRSPLATKKLALKLRGKGRFGGVKSLDAVK